MKILFVEGLDGIGKTTMIKRIKGMYEKQGKKVMSLKFPLYKKDTGKIIKDLHMGKKFGPCEPLSPVELDPYTATSFYIIDRVVHLKNHLKHAEANSCDLLIIDRGYFSNFIYQGAKIFDKYHIYDFIMKYPDTGNDNGKTKYWGDLAYNCLYTNGKHDEIYDATKELTDFLLNYYNAEFILGGLVEYDYRILVLTNDDVSIQKNIENRKDNDLIDTDFSYRDKCENFMHFMTRRTAGSIKKQLKYLAKEDFNKIYIPYFKRILQMPIDTSKEEYTIDYKRLYSFMEEIL